MRALMGILHRERYIQATPDLLHNCVTKTPGVFLTSSRLARRVEHMEVVFICTYKLRPFALF